jgi:hypothetical protein
MKRSVVLVLIILNWFSVMAQNMSDAIRYSQTDLNGNARYLSMAGAWGALGGNGSSIWLNPAGLGIYRSSDISVSGGFILENNDANWNNQNTNWNNQRVALDNISFILSFGLGSSWYEHNNYKEESELYPPKDERGNDIIRQKNNSQYTRGIEMLYLNFGFSFNQLKRFNRQESFSEKLLTETDNHPIPSYSFNEGGYINEWALSLGTNFNNLGYCGLGVGIRDLKYNSTLGYDGYISEESKINHVSNFNTEGMGWNLKAGMIIRPIHSFRLGASLQTATVYKLKSKCHEGTSSEMENSYNFQDPFQFTLSAATVLGKRGIISADFVRTNYTSMQFSDSDNNIDLEKENSDIKNLLKNTNTLRIGGELILSLFALRAGYAFESPISNEKIVSLNNNVEYICAGIGYRSNVFYFDLSYQLKKYNQEFYPFYNMVTSSNKLAKINRQENNIIISLGWRF